MLNLITGTLFSDINRRLAPLVRGTGLLVDSDEPAGFGGVFRSVTLSKPLAHSTDTGGTVDQRDHIVSRRLALADIRSVRGATLRRSLRSCAGRVMTATSVLALRPSEADDRSRD
jgi:hypothetical protein